MRFDTVRILKLKLITPINNQCRGEEVIKYVFHQWYDTNYYGRIRNGEEDIHVYRLLWARVSVRDWKRNPKLRFICNAFFKRSCFKSFFVAGLIKEPIHKHYLAQSPLYFSFEKQFLPNENQNSLGKISENLVNAFTPKISIIL